MTLPEIIQAIVGLYVLGAPVLAWLSANDAKSECVILRHRVNEQQKQIDNLSQGRSKDGHWNGSRKYQANWNPAISPDASWAEDRE